MVKQSEQANSCVSSRKRVSFDVGCKSEDYSPREETEVSIRSVSDLLHDDEGIERILKVMQSLTAARVDGFERERFAEISKTTNAERNELFKQTKRIAKEFSLYQHQNLENSTHLTKNAHARQNDTSRVETAKDAGVQPSQVDSCKQPEITSSQGAVDGTPLRVNSVVGLADYDVQSPSDSTATDGTGSGSSSRRGSGDSLHETHRGYSSQRRHGRKDSLGTVDFTRLIPTLVSDNEDFRYKEYQRKLSVQSIELQQNTW